LFRRETQSQSLLAEFARILSEFTYQIPELGLEVVSLLLFENERDHLAILQLVATFHPVELL